MNTFMRTDLLGDIVARYPGAADYFIEKQIDFCCGGERSLALALGEMGMDEVDVLSELNGRYEKFKSQEKVYTDWASAEPNRLIEHIEAAHHQYLRESLPQISGLLFKLLGVHGKNHSELFEIHRVFNALRTELEGHLVKEEVWLFPEITSHDCCPEPDKAKRVSGLLHELEEEHEGAGDALKQLRELTDHYQPPADACPTYKLTFEKLRALEKNTFEHVHLENNILFKKYR